jgi:MFS family permease
MSQILRLKEAERKAFRLSHSADGLYDAFLGLFIMLVSTLPWMDSTWLPSPWNVVLVEGIALICLLGVLAIKKFVVAPRIGQVRYGPYRKKRLKRLAAIMVIMVFITVILFGLTLSAIYLREPIWKNGPQWDLPLDPVHTAAGVFILGIFCLIGYMNDYPRLYLYGGLFGAGYIVSTTIDDLIGIPFYWPCTIVGVLVLMIGLILFSRFLKQYPISASVLDTDPRNMEGRKS